MRRVPTVLLAIASQQGLRDITREFLRDVRREKLVYQMQCPNAVLNLKIQSHTFNLD